MKIHKNSSHRFVKKVGADLYVMYRRRRELDLAATGGCGAKGGDDVATYKQPCIHCGEMIERDSRLCPKCASISPFGHQCPSCLKSVERGHAVCSGCGRALTTVCPLCNGQTFVGSEKCDACGKSLMVCCENKRCEQLQFFENTKCTACGKPIKNAKKQLLKGKK